MAPRYDMYNVDMCTCVQVRLMMAGQAGCCPRIQFVPRNVIRWGTNMCILCNFQILTTITPALHIIGAQLGGLTHTWLTW